MSRNPDFATQASEAYEAADKALEHANNCDACVISYEACKAGTRLHKDYRSKKERALKALRGEGEKEKTPPPPKTAPGRSATEGAPFRLEVGKTYITRDGKHRAKITYIGASHDWPYHGEWIGREPRKGFDRCTTPYWAENGRIYMDNSDEPTDLVRAAPDAQRPEAKPRGKKPKAIGTDNDRFVRGRK
jgi:hypothetical protein